MQRSTQETGSSWLQAVFPFPVCRSSLRVLNGKVVTQLHSYTALAVRSQ